MLCGWGVKAGMACLQVKLCVAVSERFGNAIIVKGSLQTFNFLLIISHADEKSVEVVPQSLASLGTLCLAP